MNDLVNKHKDKIIAVIGSGPTALNYAENEDIAIALNGAILLDKRLDYFMGFDTRLYKRNYFYSNPNIPRIIGYGLSPMDELVYPLWEGKRKPIDGITHLPKEIPAPAPPHHIFFYEYRANPSFNPENTVLSSAHNIAICGVEFAALLGAKEIHIYGIDFGQKNHFYGKVGGGYSSFAPRYMNELIPLYQENGIKIKVSRGDPCEITTGDDLLLIENRRVFN